MHFINLSKNNILTDKSFFYLVQSLVILLIVPRTKFIHINSNYKSNSRLLLPEITKRDPIARVESHHQPLNVAI